MSGLLPDYYGPPFGRPFAVILNSRQTKTPVGAEAWIKKTLAAVRFFADNAITVLTSTGTHPWNFAVWAVANAGGNQIIVHPVYRDEDTEIIVNNLMLDYKLDAQRAAFMLFHTDIPASKPKAAWRERDKIIFETADILAPVSIRPRGNLAEDIDKARSMGKTVNKVFATPYSPRKREGQKKIKSIEVARKFPPEDWNYITHWTRSFNLSLIHI